jgi:hypothetical protein
MSSPSDPFSAFFESPEPADRTPSFAYPPAVAHGPGFALIDDAEGRFVVDSITGVISLSDDAMLARELGAVHVARLRVIEQSGERYEIELKLRLSGRIPQLVSQENAMTDVSAVVENDDEDVMTIPRIHWTRYVALAGLYTPASLADTNAPYGAMLAVHLPNVPAGFAGLTLIDTIPRAASRTATWTP